MFVVRKYGQTEFKRGLLKVGNCFLYTALVKKKKNASLYCESIRHGSSLRTAVTETLFKEDVF